MLVRVICPDKTLENAINARNKLNRRMIRCRKYGKEELKWIMAETTTKLFICFGAGYCTYCGALLIGHNLFLSLVIASVIFLLSTFMAHKIPLVSSTKYLVQYAMLTQKLMVLYSIIDSLDTLSHIQSESPSLIHSESGDEAEIKESTMGDITLETGNHRFIFPRASKYTIFSNVDSGSAILNFHPADTLIGEAETIL